MGHYTEQVCDYLEAQGKTKFHHETIYRMLLQDKQAGGTLYKHLRYLHKSHHKRYGSYERRGRIKNAVSIEQRPSVVDSRSRIGDWEDDTVIGKNKKRIIYTLVDRKNLYTVIVKLNSKNATELADKTLKVLESMSSKIHTITYDNGLEFAEHGRMEKALDADIYFAHPYSSWERGINENTNWIDKAVFLKGY